MEQDFYKKFSSEESQESSFKLNSFIYNLHELSYYETFESVLKLLKKYK
jgi:hypothetical protein